MKKRIIAISLAIVLGCGHSMTVSADRMNDVKKQKAQTSSQLEATKDKIDSLEEQKNQLFSEISTLDAELVQSLAVLNGLEEDITTINEEIAQTQEDLKKAEKDREEQYEAMKKRIQYLYENGDNGAWMMVLLSGGSLTDMLNSIEQTKELYNYDKKALDEYIAIVQQVTDLETQLETEKADLESLKHSQEEEKAYLEQKLEEKRATSADYENQIAAANQMAAKYQTLIADQNAEIQRLAEEQRRQEAARQEAEQQQNSSGNGNASSNTGTSKPSTSTKPVTSTGNATGAAIVNYALQFVGNPYVWGGNSLTNGIDCSGFVHQIYAHFGYSVPRQSASFRSAGRAVSFSDIQLGDIVCYDGHVAIYMGNGQLVHAWSSNTGIVAGTRVTYRPILAIRRVI